MIWITNHRICPNKFLVKGYHITVNPRISETPNYLNLDRTMWLGRDRHTYKHINARIASEQSSYIYFPAFYFSNIAVLVAHVQYGLLALTILQITLTGAIQFKDDVIAFSYRHPFGTLLP